MKKVICIVGPTASSKTKIAISLAKRLDAQIISCDSVAVYKDLDIGSAKPTLEERENIVHHLVDFLDVNEQFDVATCQKEARKIIDESSKLQILCGGTGLYVQGIINNYEFNSPKRDCDFEHKYQEYSNQELFDVLLKLDEAQANKLHYNNRKRVLRAIECALNGNSLSNSNNSHEKVYDSYIVYLDIDRDILYKRINDRVDLMIKNGLIEEVKNLYLNNIFINAIGYKEFYPYFRNEISLESVIDEIKLNTRHLAKRQKTWFKNQTDAVFYKVDLDNIDNTIDLIYKDIRNFLK